MQKGSKNSKLRTVTSVVLAGIAAYAFSFACDLLIGAWFGVYPRTAYVPVITWSIISILLLFMARTIATDVRWLALPYALLGLLAALGGLIGQRHSLLVSGAVLLHGFGIWYARPKEAETSELAALKSQLANLTWNSDVSNRLLIKARHKYPQKTETEIYRIAIAQYESEHSNSRTLQTAHGLNSRGELMVKLLVAIHHGPESPYVQSILERAREQGFDSNQMLQDAQTINRNVSKTTPKDMLRHPLFRPSERSDQN